MLKQSVSRARVKTGGKLYIAGEYSVLTAGQTALIQFIPIFMSAEVKEAPSTQLSSDMFDYSVNREPDANYALIQEALNTFEAFKKFSFSFVFIHRLLSLAFSHSFNFLFFISFITDFCRNNPPAGSKSFYSCNYSLPDSIISSSHSV